MHLWSAVTMASMLALTACVSSPKMSEEDRLLAGDWIETADAFSKANDPELRKPCKSGIAELDTLFDTVSEMAVTSINGALNTIAVNEAEKSWLAYRGWSTDKEGAACYAPAKKNDPESVKKRQMQAKHHTFMAAMLYVAKDIEADAPIVVKFQRDQDGAVEGSPVEKVAPFVAEHYPQAKLVIAQTLANTETFTEAGKAAYYKNAFQAKPMSAAERKSILEILAIRLQKALELQKRFSEVMQSEKFKAQMQTWMTAAMGFGPAAKAAKESLAAVDRGKSQLLAVIELTKFEQKALKDMNERAKEASK